MRILLVDDHPLFREALAATVGELSGNAAVEQFATVQEVTEAIAADRGGVLVLLDLNLGDNSGMLGLIGLKAAFPEISVAIVSGSDDAETVSTAEACGASGFIPKASSRRTLSAALAALLQGETWFPEHAEAQLPEKLTPIQLRILDGIKRGKMNKQIAFEIGLSEHTIKYHLSGIFRKLGCQTRAHLVSKMAELHSGS